MQLETFLSKLLTLLSLSQTNRFGYHYALWINVLLQLLLIAMKQEGYKIGIILQRGE